MTAAVAALARRADIVVEGGIVSIDGHDVTRAIRTPEIDKAASGGRAAAAGARRARRAPARSWASGGGVVMEGRDIGTVVFPDADVKIYLDASEEERARRRANDAAHTGSQAGQAAVAEAIKARDKADTTRTASPLTHGARRDPHRHHVDVDHGSRRARAGDRPAEDGRVAFSDVSAAPDGMELPVIPRGFRAMETFFPLFHADSGATGSFFPRRFCVAVSAAAR